MSDFARRMEEDRAAGRVPLAPRAAAPQVAPEIDATASGPKGKTVTGLRDGEPYTIVVDEAEIERRKKAAQARRKERDR